MTTVRVLPEAATDPYKWYATCRSESPVLQFDDDTWMLFRYGDVERMLRNPELSVQHAYARNTARNALMTSVVGDGYNEPKLARADPPVHTAVRKLVATRFNRQAIAGLTRALSGRLEALLESFDRDAPVDFRGKIGRPLAFDALSMLLGLPNADAEPMFTQSAKRVALAAIEPYPTFEMLRESARAAAALHNYLDDVLRWKQSHPGDDLLTFLFAGDLSEARRGELVGLVLSIIAAGHDTVVTGMCNAIYALLCYPGELARLRSGELDPRHALEELLRYESPAQIAWRTVPRDIRISRQTVCEGSHLIGWLGSANRDEIHWGPTGGHLNLARSDAAAHLAFGAGPHLCLGAWLTRLEMELVIRGMALRYPDIALATTDISWERTLSMRSIGALPIVLGSRHAR